ncbi:dehydrogenase, isocitrate/isopropylmalate domain protein [Peptoniphilus sp. oral taxon 375 str. F0436]|nr:dehydrogenase, isocitrate/isopropylmalate domain protein [Peptoniphilus sp. oral taxon 375 str. F0436]
MISLIPGDGVGKELAKLLIRLFKDLQIPLSFDIQEAGKEEYAKHGVYLPDSLFRSLEKTRSPLRAP